MLQQLERSQQQEQVQQQQQQQQERVLPLQGLSWFAALQTQRPLRRLLWLMGLESAATAATAAAAAGDNIFWLPQTVSAATWRDRLRVFEAMHASSLD
ncbi:hypothetical protein ETH_00036990, partial [Eimeria tenella]